MKDAKTCKEALVELRAFFDNPAVDREQKRQLYHVLSAIRGPDMGPNADNVSNELTISIGEAKDATTAVIRERIFGSIPAAEALPGLASVNPLHDWIVIIQDNSRLAAIRPKLRDHSAVGWHFIDHVMKAFGALGMGWRRNSTQPQEASHG